MEWIVLSPFTRKKEPEWIFEFIDSTAHPVKAVPSTYYHDRSRKSASISDWIDYLFHGVRGFLNSFSMSQSRIGIITVFPQLALIVALLKKITGRKNLPLIAWCFNLGRPYQGLKGKLARFCLSSIDIFVVHSTAEIEIYSKWLDLPPEKFVFVHLSTSDPDLEAWQERNDDPYVLALGTANRDYALLTTAVAQLGYKTIIVAGAYATEHINAPDFVIFKSGLSIEECHRLAIRSRINVIPIADIYSPSGQVTVIESMMRGVPLIATECAGTMDYIEDGMDGLLAKANDVASMIDALERLWGDEVLRSKLSSHARQSAFEKFTFKVASSSLLKLIQRFEKSI